MANTPKVHRPSGVAGGDKLEVESGGEIEIKSGGVIDVQAAGGLSLAAGEIAEADIAAGAVTSTKLGLAAVTETYIGDGAVVSKKLALAAVSETYIGDGAVVSKKLALAAVSETYIATGAVTSVKRKETITEKSASAYLLAAEAGIIKAMVDDIYLYLPTYVGNTGLNFLIKVMASHSAGVAVCADTITGGTLDGAAKKTSAAQYNALEVVCDGTQWLSTNMKGTWN